MFQRLSSDQFSAALPLVRGLDYQLTVAATLTHTNPGAVFVDNPSQPSTVYISAVEGEFLAGDPDNRDFNASLNSLLEERLFCYPQARWWVGVDDPQWLASLPAIVNGRPFEAFERLHYVCTQLKLDAHASLPDGFNLRTIDADMLADSSIQRPGHIDSWIENNWGSHGSFLQKGVGAVVTHGHNVVSWCVADCAAGNQIEIGIQTAPDYRRQGLAACAVALAVEQAFQRGYTLVGWHCHADNTGSHKTAEKVGFQLERTYRQFLI